MTNKSTNKLSLNQIFNTNSFQNNNIKQYKSNKFSLNTLFNKTINNDISHKDNNDDFDSKILIEEINRKRLECRNNNLFFYNKCCKEIIDTNKLNKRDLIFKLPEYLPNYNKYDHELCIKYIEKKLIEQFIDVYRINNKTLFITWNYIELNKK